MAEAQPRLPDGLRLYAIGDIHGRLDLLEQLLAFIDDECKKDAVTARKIFLGDYIDRGLYSRQIVDYLIGWAKKEKTPPIFLLGNHEQTMRDILVNKDPDLLRDWMSFGGRETLMSYSVRPVEDPAVLVADLVAKMPPAHLDFLQKLELFASFGDYYFCHAGVRPGLPLEAQKEEDLIWIRHEFLSYDRSFGKMVVHGHSIRLEAEFRPNRIGIDTGAYATGCLTALGLEQDRQWLIQTK